LGFPVSRQARDRFRISDLVASPGEAAGGAMSALRSLADRLNASRDSQTSALSPVHAGRLASFSLITEVLRYLADRYCTRDYSGAMLEALDTARATNGPAFIERPMRAFVDLYPPERVRRGEQETAAYVEGATAGRPNRYVVAREIVLLRLATENPALKPFQELYDDTDLKRQAPYEPLVDSLESFFATRPPFRGSNDPLIEFLRAPMRASPDSIEGQIEYIRTHWVTLLPPDLLEQLLLATDIMREEILLRGHGPGPTQVLHFGPEYLLDRGYPEPAAFTHDKDWMSNVVLIAKSVYVWLDQLSRKYQRAITRLDQIPDEELDRLARWGFTGLWLIGVWERSPASQKIKQIMGNPEALSSAYSLYDYVIAGDLGGEPAYRNLRDRAWRRRIRLASDMVPNHVGLYSQWVIEHPDWFLQLPHPPFPSYRFAGPDLSWDPRVGLYIEDGYWEHRDAAVVFKREDKWTGDIRYIYHGNDGTSMPWNDTAQLNFLLPEVREAVVQTILHVARLFPVLRFDAAMALAKRHYQRLWFPKPGDAGAVPSRAEHGMSKAQFDEAFPKEFWREVVDRVQQEAPDTLLLAEAFWLMEGYFVRTLGMHRVYNSAFMNMLEMEENSKYRATVKNVLEFTPEVLKRFVNFMSNPDERTAVEQFGKGDKYYGIAVLMVTMPGLPMFGHGQIEGFAEKYGMEYRRAYRDEAVDGHMVWRHENEIFPLMRKRRLFSGAEHFAFYDARTPAGWVDENVFAYSNRAGAERALILYNNAYTTTQGTIHTSTAINVGDADTKQLCRRTLAEALALDTREDCYYVFRDHKTKLEYVRHAPQLDREGLSFELHAYEYHAFLDFREVYDTDGAWARLCASLDGRGVPSIEDEYREMILEPIHAPFRKVMNAEMLRALTARPDPAARARFEQAMAYFFSAVADQTAGEIRVADLIKATQDELEALRQLPGRVRKARVAKPAREYLLGPMPAPARAAAAEPSVPEEPLGFWRVPLALALTHQVARFRAATDYSAYGAGVDEWLLTKVVAEAFTELGGNEAAVRMDALLVKILAAYPTVLDFFPGGGGAIPVRRMFEDVAVQRYLLMNRYDGVIWLNKEQMEKLVYWLFFESVVSLAVDARLTRDLVATRYENAMAILNVTAQAGYQVERILQLLAQEK
jgi:glycosidase